MKYKDKNDFAEKVVNKIPYIQDLNIRVKVTEYSMGFVPRKGAIFHGGNEITASLMNHLEGVVDGLRYAYSKLVKEKK